MYTTAPADLQDLQALYVEHTGVRPTSAGVVPDARHLATGGYHCGYRDLANHNRLQRDYSWRKARDRRVTTDHASAIDLGAFDREIAGRRVTLPMFSEGLAAAIANRDPRTAPIRQLIYADTHGQLHNLDVTGEQTGASSDHRSHSHLSLWRDTVGQRAGLLSLFTELLTNGGRPIMSGFIGLAGKDEVFYTDGTLARWVSEGEIADVRTLAGEGVYPALGFGGAIRWVTRRELVGRIVGVVPPGWEDLAIIPKRAPIKAKPVEAAAAAPVPEG